MKKIVCIALVGVCCFSLCACGSKSASEAGAKSQVNTESAQKPSSTKKQENKTLTNTEIETKVKSALKKEINSKYKTADPESCRYSINKTETNNGYIYVYGKVTLYDKYGKTTTGHVDKSGTAYRSFDIKIKESTGAVSSCSIK